MRTVKPGTTRQPVGLLAVQWAAALVAAALLAVAIAGFTPGLTYRLDTLRWFGHHSHAELFGIFEISMLHNLVHLGVGIAGLVLVSSYARARAYLVGGGLIFVALWLCGLLVEQVRNALPLNDADNWLHFSIGAVMVLLGLTLAGTRVPTGAGGEPLLPED